MRMVYHSYRVPDAKFVEAWETSASLTEVAAKTGMPASNCATRAYRLRDQDVPLAKLPRRKKEKAEAEGA